jgi:flagella basal body P-ring formation protein FlgA
MKKALALAGILVWGLSGKWVFAKEGVLIRLPVKATVVGPRISVGEISEVIGTDRYQLDRFRKLDLGRAAPAGQVIKVTAAYIRIALRREGYGLDQFDLLGEEQVEVLTQSQKFGSLDFLPAAKEFIRGELKESAENVDVKLAGTEKKLFLPAGKVGIHFRSLLSGKYEGYTLLTAEVDVDGRLVQVLPLRLKVEVLHEAVTTVKRVERGEPFTKENVVLEKWPTSKIPREVMESLENVLGRTAAAAVPPRAIIRLNDLYDPPVIKRGQKVNMVARRGNIEIWAGARAIEDGKAGDTIRVENDETHKTLHGKVLDEKTVLIEDQ